MAITIMVTPCRSIFTFLLCSCLSYWVVSLYLEDLKEIHIRSTNQKSLEPESVENKVRFKPGNSTSHLHWFVQISDLHLSVFDGSAREDDLLKFCKENLNIIKPEVVLVTGDLTDAKLRDKQGSRQFIEEWRSYGRVLNESGIAEKTVWLDIRGNHDAFDVPSLTSSKNYFGIYSVSGRSRTKSYQYVHRTPDGDSFSFIAVDSVPIPGPRRPFNFFGIIDKSELDRIEGFVKSTSDVTQTIFFGHYPTSTINYPQHILRDILGRGMVYLCGHLHTLGGFVPRMYALQQTGYLELELGDWREARLYRLVVVDHGLLSFVDVDMHTWPVVLVTNPKSSQFFVNKHENVNQIRDSTHIRILVFTRAASVALVVVSVDGKELGQAQHVDGPLYVLLWNTSQYDNNSHHIHVYVKDSDGREASYDQPFSLQYSQPTFGFWRRFLLMSDHTSLLQMIFAGYFTLTVLPLIIVRVFQVHLTMVAQSRVSSCLLRSAQMWLRRFNLLAIEPKIYYPLLFYNAYILVGPWFIGEVLEGHIGACFLFGIFVKGTWIPCSLTYFYGALQLIIFNLSLSLYLGTCLDLQRCADKDHSLVSCRPQNSTLRWFYSHWFFILIITIQIYLVLAGFYKAYGIMALALCPMRTWAVCLALYLRYQALRPQVAPVREPARTGTALVADS